ncbi:MAG: hypothetical protein EZS28_043388 [Streblomastix strix]|uniref:Uncharacterized protein n=1 Tax=Streblomastix strix TaxID=222440 RepID=A0A5J4TUK4_9EUKA|nr:MAG: hypothetical protein EZS28_043388 [Streblomastix strix]
MNFSSFNQNNNTRIGSTPAAVITPRAILIDTEDQTAIIALSSSHFAIVQLPDATSGHTHLEDGCIDPLKSRARQLFYSRYLYPQTL